ncbi:MAG: hypothetical protein QXV17_00230 [Candidatus Micrarchaeaceae archaeon]
MKRILLGVVHNYVMRAKQTKDYEVYVTYGINASWNAREEPEMRGEILKEVYGIIAILEGER